MEKMCSSSCFDSGPIWTPACADGKNRMKRTCFWITRLQPFPFTMMAFGHILPKSQIISLLHKALTRQQLFTPQKIAVSPPPKEISAITTPQPNKRTRINPSWEKYTTDVKTSWQRFATVLFHSPLSSFFLLVPHFLSSFLPSLTQSSLPTSIRKEAYFESSLATDLWVQTNTNTTKRWLHQMDPLQDDVLQT